FDHGNVEREKLVVDDGHSSARPRKQPFGDPEAPIETMQMTAMSVGSGFPLAQERRERGKQHGDQIGSHANTSPERSSGVSDGPKAPLSCSAMLSGVQPSERCMTRIGRGWLNRKISLLRTAKICPETPSALSEPR